MIDGVTPQGGLPGLPGRVTLSAGMAMCFVNVSKKLQMRQQPKETSARHPRFVRLYVKRGLFFDHG